MPDALSKTVPIWCCVLNRALFPDAPECHGLYVPPNAVSDSEKSQIEARIPSHVDSLLRLDIDLASLRHKITHPLRPIWITQDDAALEEIAATATGRPAFESFHPVLCCTSSRRVVGAEMSEGGYIQGAGDDTENWAHGLTAPLFWTHADELLHAPEASLPDLIASLIEAAGNSKESKGDGDVRQLTPRLAVCPLPVPDDGLTADANTCLVSIVPTPTEQDTWAKSSSRLEVGLGKHKAASRNLRKALPAICDFVFRFLTSRAAEEEEEDPSSAAARVLVACESGRDLSVGVALALDCRCFGDDGALRSRDGEAMSFTKDAIRVRLGRMMTAAPEANPSRATLQSVNSFLMDWR